jgi:tetratricopeptide (TPR) repeat protein
MSSDDLHNPDRRTFLRRAALAAGVGAALPLLGSTADRAAAAWGGTTDHHQPHDDPDQLLQDGRFDEAERAFKRVLRQDPNDAHAAAQLGYIALLSNRFEDAETFLTKAVTLAPDDSLAQQRLGDCFVRQDQLARAVDPLRASGTPDGAAFADLYARMTSMSGQPWQIDGADSTRAPLIALDPLPFIQARANGGPLRNFGLDTGVTSVAMSKAVADELGLQPVSTWTVGNPGQTFTLYLGVLDSLTVGDIELRNLPILWNEFPTPTTPDGTPTAGWIGTTLFYHFLTTMDYADQALVLRRKTRAQLHQFQVEARRAHAEKLPLWLAGDHVPCTLGSLRDYGPKVVTVDTASVGSGISTTVKIAEQAGIEVDYAHPEWVPTPNGLIPAYPIMPDEISLGRAVGHNVRGSALQLATMPADELVKFKTIANFSHIFLKPFAITFDYLAMNLYLTGESLKPGS